MPEYQKPDDYVWINKDDPDLWPICIDQHDLIRRTYRAFNQTEPTGYPRLKDIDGYGKDPKDQYFRRQEYPVALRDLERKLRNAQKTDRVPFIRRELNLINEFWDALDSNQQKYEKEIQWIERQWYYRLFGYWFFNNGKPVYITGAHQFYLNYWYLDSALPEYRDRDRRWFIAQQFLLTDTTTFLSINPKTRMPIPTSEGRYEMTDIGRRVWYGSLDSKARRVGDTSKSQCLNTEGGTRTEEAHVGIQGKDEDNSSEVFSHHFVTPFKKLPIIFKPLFESLDPRSEMIFDSEDPEIGLGTRFDFATSADRSAYDGYKLNWMHVDEPGKTKGEFVSKRHEVAKLCLSLGSEIFGFTEYTSTTDEINERGGAEFLKLAMSSMYQKRDSNGSTESGLCVVFFRASDGLQGFVDKYGESVEDEPTPEQAKHIGKRIGARQYLMNQREALEKAGNVEQLSLHKRQFPMSFKEAFAPQAKGVVFRVDLIEKQLNALMFQSDICRTGNLYWKSFNTEVAWEDDPNGKFKLYRWPDDHRVNKSYLLDNVRYPLYPDIGVCAADPFRLEKSSVEGSRLSKGSGAWRLKHNPVIDPPERNVLEWETAFGIMSYNFRPDTVDEYCEDVLMGCVWLGYLCYPENNIDNLIRHFINRGFGGYLLYDVDERTGKPKNTPGFYSTADVKRKLVNFVKDEIAKNCFRIRDVEFLKQCLRVQSIDDLTDLDLFVAWAGTLMAEQSTYQDFLIDQHETYDTSKWLPSYNA